MFLKAYSNLDWNYANLFSVYTSYALSAQFDAKLKIVIPLKKLLTSKKYLLFCFIKFIII